MIQILTGIVIAAPRRRLGRGDMEMLELLRGVWTGLTVHGFRSSFRDWAAEATIFPQRSLRWP